MVIYNGPPPGYCKCCYSDAEKKGRPVRETQWGKVCSVCESRLREGLVKYRPSNGTEYMIFEECCGRCRHRLDEGEDLAGQMCQWKILDRLTQQMWSDYDAECNWFLPEDISCISKTGEALCPAECLRFTDKRDGDGATRDPPPKDCIGQLTFSDVLAPHEPSAKEREGVSV